VDVIGPSYSIDQIYDLLVLLSRNQSKAGHNSIQYLSGRPMNQDINFDQISLEKGHIDSKIVRKIAWENQKKYGVAWTKDSWQTMLKTLEYLYKTNPGSHTKSHVDMRTFQLGMIMVNKRYKLPLNDMVRVSNIILHHSVKPTFFFSEMVQSPFSFATDV